MAESTMLVLIGSGPGIGVNVASVFAQKYFNKVALLSRNADRLSQDAEKVREVARSAGRNEIEVSLFTADISDSEDLRRNLKSIQSHGAVECIYFNAARVAMVAPKDETIEDLERDFRITNTALHITAFWGLPLLQETGKAFPNSSPSLLVTNSMLYRDPIPPVYSLSITKAAQRILVRCLNAEHGKDVHIALVSVEGQVSPDKPHMSPQYIANKAWELFSQPKDSWSLEIEIPEK